MEPTKEPDMRPVYNYFIQLLPISNNLKSIDLTPFDEYHTD